MIIKSVKTPLEEQLFLKLPIKLYKDNKFWIRPLDKDIKSVFDVKKNSVATADNFMRWILYDNHENTIGRIAAFVNPKTVSKNNEYPVGGIGFFECIDHQEAANLLFETAKNWLSEKGMEAMEGPNNLGDRDKFWGLLTYGFDQDPNYLANFNPPYYQQLFENFGFKLYYNHFTFSRIISVDFPETSIEKGMQILQNPDYYFTGLKKNQLDKFTEDFRTVYNKAWVGHMGVSELKSHQAKSIMKQLKPVIEENTAFFGYYKNEPIAFFINIPEVNQIFKYVNGKLNWWGKLLFIVNKILRKNQKLLGIGFGVTPEFDGKGVTQAMTIFAGNLLIKKTKFKNIEMHGIGDFNPGMIRFVEKMGKSNKNKIHTVYRYLFDRNKPFERMPLKTNKNG